MKQRHEQIKAAWQRRQPREQRALLLLACAVLALVLWQAVWSPLQHWRDRQQADSTTAKALYQHLRTHMPALLAARAAATHTAQRSLPELATGLALQAGVNLQAPQADASGNWQLQASAAQAPVLLQWLQQLQQAGVQVSSLQLQATSEGWELSAQARR